MIFWFCDFVSVLPRSLPCMDKSLLTPCTEIANSPIFPKATLHSFYCPLPHVCGLSDESLALWDDSISLGAVISLCSPPVFWARFSCPRFGTGELRSWQPSWEKALSVRIRRNLQRFVCSILYSIVPFYLQDLCVPHYNQGEEIWLKTSLFYIIISCWFGVLINVSVMSAKRTHSILKWREIWAFYHWHIF